MKLFLTSQLTALAPPHNFCIQGELQESPAKVTQVWIHFQNCLVPLGSLPLIIFFSTDVSTAADLNAGTALIKIVFLK